MDRFPKTPMGLNLGNFLLTHGLHPCFSELHLDNPPSSHYFKIMPRRASSGISPGLLIGVIVVIAALFFGGKMMFSGKSETPLSGSELDMVTVEENANSLRGNEYIVEGKIDDQVLWTADKGQVVSLKVDSPAGAKFLGIEIPPGLSNVNIEREQTYAFRVSFRQGGIAVAEEITRR